MDKQIFAALEIADHEVRLLVGEFFNTRFNIIKVERECNTIRTFSNLFEFPNQDICLSALKRL